jgi:hypothetical protein
MRNSIIGPWHFGHAGLSIATDELGECWDWDAGMMIGSTGGSAKLQSPVDAEDEPMMESPCPLGFPTLWSILTTFKNYQMQTLGAIRRRHSRGPPGERDAAPGEVKALADVCGRAICGNVRSRSGCCGDDFGCFGKVLLSRYQHDGRKRQDKHGAEDVVHCRSQSGARPNNVGRALFRVLSKWRVCPKRFCWLLNSVAVCADTYAHARSPDTDAAAPLLAVTPALDIALARRVSV